MGCSFPNQAFLPPFTVIYGTPQDDHSASSKPTTSGPLRHFNAIAVDLVGLPDGGLQRNLRGKLHVHHKILQVDLPSGYVNIAFEMAIEIVDLLIKMLIVHNHVSLQVDLPSGKPT